MIRRLIATLSLIPRPPEAISAHELAQRLALRDHHVTPRTVQRDLIALAEHVPLESRTTSKPYGWSWVRGATCPCCGGNR